MKSIKKLLTVLIILFTVIIANNSCTQKPQLNAVIITGQNNHNWQRSTLFFKDILEKSGIFYVDIKISPQQGKDMSEFVVDFEPYDVVVLDYNGDDWPEKTKTNFENYVQNGGGVVVYHAADNAFPDWAAFNEIIGLGGWGDRDESSGPYVYIENGEVVYDNSPGRGGSHGAQHEFLVEAFEPSHPVLKGLPQKWLHTKDELYSELRGPAKNMKILAYAHADKKYNGTGRNEPVLMTIDYGKGRVFHTVLGHCSSPFSEAMESAGFIVTLQRGAEWAATGRVTQKIPENFPTETKSLSWKYFEDIDENLALVMSRMKSYETGSSYENFNILKSMITESAGDVRKTDEIHSEILKLLKSDKTTNDCKKVLCTEFSWFANESYRPVYEELKKNPDLAGAAQYALDMMGD